MSRYQEYNGSFVDYDLDTGELDSGNRRYNRSVGRVNPEWEDREEYEPEMFDEDCW